jgi:hypothetical protein
MALDPYIARGITPLGLGLPELALEMRGQQQRNDIANRSLDLDAQGLGLRRQEFDFHRQQAERAQYSDAQIKAATEMANMVYSRIKAGDRSAVREAVDGFSSKFPNFARFAMQDPQGAEKAAVAQIESFLRIEPEKPMPAVRDLGLGVTAVMQGNEIVGSPQFPQRAPLPGPESFSPFTDASGKVHFLGNRGTIRETPLTGQLSGGRDRPSETGMKASDSNAIVSAAARAWGGVYDPLSGNITGIGKDDLLNLNKVASRASDIFFENNGQVPHATAVQRALEEFRGGKQGRSGRADFSSEDEAQAALEAGKLSAGDTVYINGQPAFRVE